MNDLLEEREWLSSHGFRQSESRPELWVVEHGFYVLEPSNDTDWRWFCHIHDEEGAIMTKAYTPSEAVESALNGFDEVTQRLAETRSEESERLRGLVSLKEDVE